MRLELGIKGFGHIIRKHLSTYRPRRSLFYGTLLFLIIIIYNYYQVPGSDERKIKSSLQLSPDCLVYDLEDSVPVNRKGEARQQVFRVLEVG